MIERLRGPKSWNSVIEQEYDKDYYKRLEWLVQQEYLQYKCYPDESEIFKAFELTPPESIKCVILAQDPYPKPDKAGYKHAHGLAFSSLSKVEIPRSLKVIYGELKNSIPDFRTPAYADLTSWAEQGVLLLNCGLTVRAGIANSHTYVGWSTFTDAVIEAIGKMDRPIAFCLWGTYAQQKAKLITGEDKLVLEASHPSPLAAYRSFIGCNHFNLVNEFLTSHGIEPINWGSVSEGLQL